MPRMSLSKGCYRSKAPLAEFDERVKQVVLTSRFQRRVLGLETICKTLAL